MQCDSVHQKQNIKSPVASPQLEHSKDIAINSDDQAVNEKDDASLLGAG
jgi:hypothetical protein